MGNLRFPFFLLKLHEMNQINEYLSQFLTDNRRDLIESVLNERTRYITVALEDIYQSQNASAVLRTCDCFGVQNVNVIENNNEFTLNKRVTLGSSKWLSIRNFNEEENNTLHAINSLKNEGYRIIATTPHTNDVDLEEFDLEGGKFALIFGTEKRGISNVVKENADGFMKIPMYGFTESFNISVSAAIVLHHLTNKLRKSEIAWQMSEEEKDDLRFEWYQKSIKRSEILIEQFLNQ